MTTNEMETIILKVSGKANKVIFTQNRRSIVSFKYVESLLVIRVSERKFRDAPESIIVDLANYINGDQAASLRLNQFINAIQEEEEYTKELNPKGFFYDLNSIMESLNKEFNLNCNFNITWHRSKRVGKHSVQLGLCQPAVRVILVNSVLDAEWVPLDYIRFVVYHEMLHAVLGVQCVNGRRQIHTPAFRVREKMFPGYAKAMQWEKANIKALINNQKG